MFESMVDLSDHGDILQQFLELPLPRVFVYGAQNRFLSHLPALAAPEPRLLTPPSGPSGPAGRRAPTTTRA